MATVSTIKVSLGQSSKTGLRERNEDFYACVIPSEFSSLEYKGLTAVIADGVGGSDAGMEASQYAVGGFFSDYYSTPDSWSISQSVERVVSSINRWLYGQGQRASAVKGLVTTFSLLTLCGRKGHIFHVGDSRIYRFRNGNFEGLTTDHNAPQNPQHLVRGLGLDSIVKMDSVSFSLEEGDIFVMTTDGVHGSLDKEDFVQILETSLTLENKAHKLTNRALEKGSGDNLTCQILQVDELPPIKYEELKNVAGQLSFPNILYHNDCLDSYRVISDIASGGMGSLYLGEEIESKKKVVLKCPHPDYEQDVIFRERFLREEWVGRRVNSPYLMNVLSSAKNRRNFLYLVLEHCPGKSIRTFLEDQIFSVDDVVAIGKQLCRGLGSLHNLNIIHRDFKPDNIIIDAQNNIKIVDYGVVLLPALPQVTNYGEKVILGSPNYLAPEMFSHARGSVQSDIFSLGVTLYEMLTGEYPYGEIEKGDEHNKKRYKDTSKLKPEVPLWLDTIVKKAVQKKSENRYESVSEILFYLNHPQAVIVTPEKLSLIEKDPLVFWKVCTLLFFLLNLVQLIYWIQ
ncbi:MAG: serine/threonine protein phosphatase PrpC [bacterium]|jgi:serine/threonine protein phosphatase PrpC